MREKSPIHGQVAALVAPRWERRAGLGAPGDLSRMAATSVAQAAQINQEHT